MKTPRLPAMVSSHETAKRSALGLPAPSVRAKTLRMSQTSAAAASSIPPGRSSRRFMRSAGSSHPNGAPPDRQRRGRNGRQWRKRRHRPRKGA